MNIAVIGSGISGLSAAYFLAQNGAHRVTLFEADDRVGGQAHTLDVPLPRGGTQPVDIGWVVYNRRSDPNLSALFDELAVATRPTAMSFAVSLDHGGYEWKGSEQWFTLFVQSSNFFSLRHYRLMFDILKFNKRAKALLTADALPSGRLGDWLLAEGFSHQLMSRYLLPMVGLIWACSPLQATEYPAGDVIRFFDRHGLFNPFDPSRWRVVKQGSQAYVKALLRDYDGTVQLNTPVRAIRRSDAGVTLTFDDAERHFDQVVCATHADQALALLGSPSDAERRVLAGMAYNANRCVLHTDTSFLPRRKLAWGASNYLHPNDDIHDLPISGSYWMNALQHIPGPVNYIVTLNPQREIPADKILCETTCRHPRYGPGSTGTHAGLPSIQGNGGLWWAGAWTAFGTHEDGLKSGLRVVNGLDALCLPEWACNL